MISFYKSNIPAKLLTTSIIFILTLLCRAYAQDTLVVDTIFFKNIPINKVTANNDCQVWCLQTNTNSVYLLDEKEDEYNYSTLFQSHISSEMTSISTFASNKLFIGTVDNCMYYYNSGNFYHYNINFNVPSNVNSVEAYYINSSSVVTYIGTSSGLLKSTAIGSSFSYYNNVTSQATVLEACPQHLIYKSTNETDNIVYKNVSAIYGFTESYLPANTGNLNFFTKRNAYPQYWYLGTDSGLYKASSGTSTPVLMQNGIHVNYIYKYNHEDNLFIIGSNEGLFFYNYSSNTLSNINIPDYSTIKVFDVTEINDCVYIASNIGLIRLVNINCQKYNISFSESKQYINLSQTAQQVLFSSITSDYSNSWLWDFGDNTTSSIQNPTHTFQTIGNHIIRLTASNGYCTNTTSNIVIVYNDPSPVLSNFSQISSANSGTNINNLGKSINLFDYNNDKKTDVFFQNYNTSSMLYGNNQNFNFILSSQNFYISGYNLNSITGDFNGDNYEDVLLSGASNSKYYKNNAGTSFSPTTLSLLDSATCLSTADYDNDGYLDVFIANFNGTCRLLKNINNNSFSPINQAGLYFEKNVVFGSWMDVDNDKDMDLLILKNNNDSSKILFNNGSGTLTCYTGNTLSHIKNASSCSWGDVNNDGYMDVIILENNSNNRLFINNGQGNFTEIVNTAINFDKPNNIVGNSLADYDNDGDIDLISFSPEDSKYYKNYKNNIFVGEANTVTNGSYSNRSLLASDDFNDDGKIDLLVSLANQGSNYFYKNNYSANNNWIRISCNQFAGVNNSLIGTRIKVKATINGQNVWQTKVITSLSSSQVQPSKIQHFGLGNATIIDSIVVIWPLNFCSDMTILTNIIPNQLIEVAQVCDKYCSSIGYKIGFDIAAETIDFTSNQPAVFTNTSSGATSYLWDFGDETTSSAVNPIHYYQNPNTYTIKLIAYADYCSDSLFKSLVISYDCQLLNANFLMSANSNIIGDIAFTNISEHSDSLFWDFGDGNISKLENPTHQYSDTGNYNISLIDFFGICSDTTYKNIEIYTPSFENQFDLESFNVYPNPANEKITIFYNSIEPHKAFNLKIINSLGIKILDADYSKNKITLNSKILEKGCYIFKFTTSEKTKYKKIIIN